MKIYMPDIKNYRCFVVQSEDIIRAYETIPRNNTNINYRDYYINSDYIYRDGTQSFSQYATLPVCLSSDVVTDDFYYRLDIDKILLVFTILVIFGILIPIKIFSRIFKRGALW